nr:hypothetical protein HK105_000504 [Polyrhizophydium stewartii]
MPGRLAPNVHAVSERARSLTHGVVCDRTSTEREAKRESIYHRREHQVLGRPVISSVSLPEFTNDQAFKFGKESKKGTALERLPKQLIGDIDDNADLAAVRAATEVFVVEDDDDVERIHRQYVLSHGSYKPGERRMHYGPNWQAPIEDKKGFKHMINNDGSRVRESMYWEDQRQQETKSKLISSRLADFRERRQPEIGKVHDPIKSTMAHLPESHTFGITFPADEYSVRELLGYTHPLSPSAPQKDKTKLPPAGLPTNHHDDLDQRRHIVPRIRDHEDKTIVLKITEDVPGGSSSGGASQRRFDLNHVFGVPTVREPRGRARQKRLADNTNYGDELTAKGLVYPTPRNVYGIEQLRKFERQLSEMHAARAVAS